MDAIGDPKNRFSSNYYNLNSLRNEFVTARNQLSGSKTLFNEICILYKLYFNQSIFETIKNIIPGRANVLTGILIEPTILERSKYQAKEIISDLNCRDVSYYNTPILHYFHDTSSLCHLTTSIDYGTTIDIDASNVKYPTRYYPVNYVGNYIRDISNAFELGHFAGGVLSHEELDALLLFPLIGISINGSYYAGDDMTFIANGNAASIEWNFGDGIILSINPSQKHTSHFYSTNGTYLVSLTGSAATPFFKSYTSTIITIQNPLVSADFIITVQYGFPIVTFAYVGTGATQLEWDFGDGYTTTVISDLYSYITHTYATNGTYNVTLTATENNYLTSSNQDVIIQGFVPCTSTTLNSGVGSSNAGITTQIGNGSGIVTFTYNGGEIYPNEFMINIGNTNIDTGMVSNSGSLVFISDGSNPNIITNVISSHPSSEWNYRFTCPIINNQNIATAVTYGNSIPVISCNGGMPTSCLIDFSGMTHGNATIYLNSINSIPYKFIVIKDNQVITNTGYIGDPSYQSTLTTALSDQGFPDESIVTPLFMGNPVGFTFGSAIVVNVFPTSVVTVIAFSPINNTIYTVGAMVSPVGYP